jgi:hypothetical protein
VRALLPAEPRQDKRRSSPGGVPRSGLLRALIQGEAQGEATMHPRLHPLVLATAAAWLWLIPVSSGQAQVIEGTISLTYAA